MGSRLEAKSTAVRKRIEGHEFNNEDGDEYEPSKFGGFPEYFRRKKIKLQNLDAELRSKSGENPPVFRGVVAHVNGYTQPSLNDLHALIVGHGGGFIQYLDGKTMVTHIIASNLTPKKAVEFRRYRLVKPAWVVDSVAAGKLLPWDNYRVLNEGVGQRVLGFDNGQVISQVDRRVKGYHEQTETSWYTNQLYQRESSEAVSAQPSSSTMQVLTPDMDDETFNDLPSLDSFETPAKPSEGEARQGSPNSHYSEDDHALDPAPATVLTSPPSRSAPVDVDANPKRLMRENIELTEVIGAPHGLKRARSSPSTSPNKRGKWIVPGPQKDQGTASLEQNTKLRPREGSQEPDYEMAIVKNSEALRAVSPSRLAKMTAEEHNALLLTDPRIRKSTVVNPDFLEQYYRESRLHHLSTWKADLKSQLQALTAEKSSSQRARQKRVPGARRYILHVDFDCFFAAVSLKKYPQYKDKPAVVAHGGGSGSEIASCNYPAREFGVRNGMWMKRAQELCPDLKILPYDFPGYEEASRRFYDAILSTGGVVQSVSIDEALVDVSAACITAGGTDGVKRSEGSNYREQAMASEIAQQLRDQVLERTGCVVSVGIGGNILLAKIALRKAKPAGQYHLKPEEVLEVIGKLEVQDLPGVAYSIGGKLEEIGVKLVKDIRDFSREKLINTLGPKTGEKIWDYARGLDKTEVGEQGIRKSVSAEVNWGVRFENHEQVEEFIASLCAELHKRLLKEGVKGGQLTMKIMRRAPDAPLDPPKHLGHGKCDTFNKSLILGVATNDSKTLMKEAMSLLKGFGFSPGELRGIGVQMTKLEPLKPGTVEGSQKRLQFKVGEPSKPATKHTVTEDPIQDDVQTPKKATRIRDIVEPSIPANLRNAESPSRKPLNMLGTQFILPTQVDPKVLAELPEDIRLKLARHIELRAPALPPGESEGQRRPVSNAQSLAITLPNYSQLDPNILNALPNDVRSEILAFYQTSPRKARAQSLLPQSPRKVRTIPLSKKPLTRKRGGGFFGRGRTAVRSSDNSTLTQSNFVARPALLRQSSHKSTIPDTDGEDHAKTEHGLSSEIDPEFLAALPEDIRYEVLADQRRERLKRTSGIDISLHQKPRARRAAKNAADSPTTERLFRLPPRPAKPTFTAKKLAELPELRQAVKVWYEEFSDEGPYEEDVVALVKYLIAVVVEERDLSKAVSVVKWMGWVIDGDGRADVGVREKWEQAIVKVKHGVQQAVRERGLGEVDLS
ncbi:deoxycytidyl transferase [Elasticomyces elasticus]|nr:deoxycytidyl transferase [Elasticomyces elasticus]